MSASDDPSTPRFAFGKNWTRFLGVLNDERIAIAENSLRTMLGIERLDGKSFLDIGSGSGLFSLAARRLGAAVRSFDYDPQSVACAKELKRRFFPQDAGWAIDQGSVLNRDFLRWLGRFDIVYSWGVLHHTGDMWAALENAAGPVADKGRLFIAIYNDQGWRSKAWRAVKKIYCSGRLGRILVSSVFIPAFFAAGFLRDMLHMKNPAARYREYKKNRGMSVLYDWIDWLGGYPFEVAAPDDIIRFFQQKGFVLSKLIAAKGLGNNQFVFVKR